MTWLLLLVPVVAIAVIVWNYRRKIAAREDAASKRFSTIFGAGRGQTADSSASPIAETQSTPVTPPASMAQFSRRERLLTPGGTLLFYLLKTGLPDYEVFAQVSLAAVLEPTGAAGTLQREAQQRRLADSMIDFLVCDKTMKAVVVVQFAENDATAKNGPLEKFLSDAGIRLVTVTPQTMPRRDTVRATILGG